jgi:hypothetical protein
MVLARRPHLPGADALSPFLSGKSGRGEFAKVFWFFFSKKNCFLWDV